MRHNKNSHNKLQDTNVSLSPDDFYGGKFGKSEKNGTFFDNLFQAVIFFSSMIILVSVSLLLMIDLIIKNTIIQKAYVYIN